MKLHWPPRALGLGPPFNLMFLARDKNVRYRTRALQSVALGVAVAVVVAVIDQLFFEGETARRTPALNAHPSPAARVGVTFVGAVVEEIYFRVFFATAVAGLAWLALRRFVGERPAMVTMAQWTGTIAAVVYVGLWHVGMVGDPSSAARVMTVNGVGNLLYGWTYWRRGLEFSVLTHGVLNATLYLGLPLLHRV